MSNLTISVPRSVAVLLHTTLTDTLRNKRLTACFRHDLTIVAAQLESLPVEPEAAVVEWAPAPVDVEEGPARWEHDEHEAMANLPLAEAVDILQRCPLAGVEYRGDRAPWSVGQGIRQLGRC